VVIVSRRDHVAAGIARRAGATLMLPVTIPGFIRNENVVMQTEPSQKGLIFVKAPKGIHKPAGCADWLAAYRETARAWQEGLIQQMHDQ
jgi:hypothetical protein